MSEVSFSNLEEFLRHHKYTKDKNKLTHTRIGNSDLGIHGGCYSIENDDLIDFYKLYYKKVFVQKQNEYLTELQNRKEGGPLLVDFDFRYDNDVTERQHSDDTISDIIDLYVENIFKLLKLEDTEFKIYVMQKDNINVLSNIVKDGIHMVFGIHMDHIKQQLLRNMLLKKSPDTGNKSVIMYECLGDLNLTNSAQDVLDEGISKGSTGWQLFGSRKPGNEAYKLTNIFTVSYSKPEEDYDDGFDITEEDIDEFDIKKLLPIISAKNMEFNNFELKEEYQEDYDKMKKKKKTKKKKNVKLRNNLINSNNLSENSEDIEDISEVIGSNQLFNILHLITDEEKLDNFIESMIFDYDIKDYIYCEVHKYTMILDESYYNPRNNWYQVGLALHHTHPNLFLTWLKFSCKSSSFEFPSSVQECWTEWRNMDASDVEGNVLGVGSIIHWAKNCDENEYQKIRKETTSELIHNSTKSGGADWDMALLAKHLFGEQYRCASIMHSIWYEFNNHKWELTQKGSSLKRKLSSVMSQMYIEESLKMLEKIRREELSQDEQKRLTGISNMYNTFASRLRSVSTKNNVMQECMVEFYDKNMEDKMDKNPYLLCFKNGVFDFEAKEFRPGKPNDFVSLCTNTNYIKINRTNEEHIKLINEINNFMAQVFPNKELRTYMWEHVASAMIGVSNDQTFNIYNGENGSNGKSKFVEFMGYVFGDYKGTVPIALITSTRPTIGSTSSEIVQLKGLRYACINEPSKGMKINEGVMKEITGGDPITGRALFKESITFTPQLKLVCCTNTLFEVDSTDGGTWRRIKVVEFQSRFCDEPSENPDDKEFKKINNLPVLFKRWAPMMASLLVEVACKNDGKVNPCDLVEKASNEYQRREDYLSRFVDEKIEKGNSSDKISKTSIQEEFKQWYEMEFGKKVGGTQDLIKHLNKKLGKYKRQGWHGFKIKYDDYPSDNESDDEI